MTSAFYRYLLLPSYYIKDHHVVWMLGLGVSRDISFKVLVISHNACSQQDLLQEIFVGVECHIRTMLLEVPQHVWNPYCCLASMGYTRNWFRVLVFNFKAKSARTAALFLAQQPSFAWKRTLGGPLNFGIVRMVVLSYDPAHLPSVA